MHTITHITKLPVAVLLPC